MAKKSKQNPRESLKIAGKSYPALVKLYNTDGIGWEDLRAEYAKLRARATRQIRRINKSDVPYVDENSQPHFKPLSELKTLSDILHETADINRFMGGAYYSITTRREIRNTVIEKLRARGWDVTEHNWLTFIAFMRWYQSQASALLYDSDDTHLIAFFNANYNRSNMQLASRWQRVYRDARKSGFFNDLYKEW